MRPGRFGRLDTISMENWESEERLKMLPVSLRLRITMVA